MNEHGRRKTVNKENGLRRAFLMAQQRCWCNWHSKYITPRERKAARPRKQIVQQLAIKTNEGITSEQLLERMQESNSESEEEQNESSKWERALPVLALCILICHLALFNFNFSPSPLQSTDYCILRAPLDKLSIRSVKRHIKRERAVEHFWALCHHQLSMAKHGHRGPRRPERVHQTLFVVW